MNIMELSNHGTPIWWVYRFDSVNPNNTKGDVFWNEADAIVYKNENTA